MAGGPKAGRRTTAGAFRRPPCRIRERRDALEAELIFDTLEEEVVPLYYARNGDGYSAEWVRRSKRAMTSVIPRFNMRRMVFDYARALYQPAARHYRKLAAQEFAGARLLAEWKQRVRQAWPKVSLRPLTEPPPDMPRGERLRLRVAAGLNGLQPADVRVEFVARRVLPEAEIRGAAAVLIRGSGGRWRLERHAHRDR